MEKSGFFMSKAGDRRYMAEHFAGFFYSFIKNGVFIHPSTGLSVVPGEGMKVILKPGEAWINGYRYENDADLEIELEPADVALNRIDRIMIRFDKQAREIRAKARASVPAMAPISRDPQRDELFHDLCVAELTVDAGLQQVLVRHITDTRYETALCGIVSSPLERLDTDAFHIQQQGYWSDLRQLMDTRVQTDTDAFMQRWEGIISRWYENVQTVEDENAMIEMMNRILALEQAGTVAEWAKQAEKPKYTYDEMIGKPTLAPVATSGSYLDLDAKPIIPATAQEVGAYPAALIQFAQADVAPVPGVSELAEGTIVFVYE